MSFSISIKYTSDDRAKDIKKAAREAELANPRPRPQTFRAKKGKGSYRRNERSNIIPLRRRDIEA